MPLLPYEPGRGVTAGKQTNQKHQTAGEQQRASSQTLTGGASLGQAAGETDENATGNSVPESATDACSGAAFNLDVCPIRQ